MKKLSLIASVLAVLGLTACEKGLDGEADYMSPAATGQVTNSMLQVRTRGGSLGDETTIAYPVQVFVFQGNDCKAVQTIGDEGQTLNIPLVEGTYSVYAVGGAGSTDYNLPTKDNATTTTALTLKEGRTLTDLMAAQATATLVDGGTNTVTLGMVRKTMLIQSVAIKKIPTAATAVSVTIAPLWQSLCIGGSYNGTTGSQTIALTKQADNRTWTLPSPFGEGSGVRLLPPSSQPAPSADELLNAEHGCALSDNQYQHKPQHRIGYYAPCCVEQSIQKHSAAVFNILANVADGGDIRCQWTG